MRAQTSLVARLLFDGCAVEAPAATPVFQADLGFLVSASPFLIMTTGKDTALKTYSLHPNFRLWYFI